MDGVSGLEEGAKSIFKDVVVQRCVVHLIRNSIKYIPSKDYTTRKNAADYTGSGFHVENIIRDLYVQVLTLKKKRK